MRKFFLLPLFLTVLNGACDKRLDLQPIGSVTEDNFYQTAEDADAAIIACYHSLILWVGDNGWMVSGLEMWGDILSSDMEPHADIVSWQQLQQSTHTPANNNIRAEWDNIYQGIYRANKAIEKIPEISMDEGLKSRLI